MIHRTPVIPFDLKRVLDEEIHRDEQVLWSCQPSTKRAFRRALPLMAFALLWLGFSGAMAFVIFRQADAPLGAKDKS